jgi:hypothetical protein
MSVFTMSWNRINKLTGHFWGERYFSRIIDSLHEYLRIFQYIIDNPVKACLVSDGRDFRFGGLELHEGQC